MPWFKSTNLSLSALERNVVFVLDPEYKFIQLRANKFGNRINIENVTFLFILSIYKMKNSAFTDLLFNIYITTM